TGTPNPAPPYLGFTRTQAVCLRFGAFAVAGATVAGLPLVASVVLTLGVLALHYYAPNRRERRKRQRAIRALSHSATAKREEWSRLARAFQQQFAGKLNELRESKEKYALLSTARQRDLERSERERETYQRKEFLERHFIKDYRIEGVGPGRRATLLSYGIETFYDVTPRAIDQVPGFGPALTSTLLGWRKRIETQFRFDQKKGVNPAAVAAIDRKYALERVPLEKRLLGGPQELTSIHRAAAQERTKIEEETAQLVRTMGQAKADVAAKERDWWVAVLCVVLLLGFIRRLAVSGTTRLASPQAIGQALESPGGPRSWGDSSPADANQPERAICQ